MMRSRPLVCAALILLVPVVAGAKSRTNRGSGERPLHASGGGEVLVSTGTVSALAARETSGPDTFVLYGGPSHPTEGKFQLADGVTPDWGDDSGDLLPGNYGGGPGAWTTHDLSEKPSFWHRSQFRGETLGPAGNHVFWCGSGNGDPNEVVEFGWATPPGYGNGWYDTLVFRHTMLDPSVGQTVQLDFDFSCDLEPGYDYFIVGYFDRSWGENDVLRIDGTHSATSFLAESPLAIEYLPDQYAWANGSYDQLLLYLRVRTDGAWSDEDGMWPSNGAVQIDNVTIDFTDGVSMHSLEDDFEIALGDAEYLFKPDEPKFAGDFATVFEWFTDIDPCRDNGSPAAGFLDFGQTVRNWKNHAEYLAAGDSTTGGSTGSTTYGIPGGFVTNYTGGLSLGESNLLNEVWSPWIRWDRLDTMEDDGPEFAGAFLRYSTWGHLPLVNGFVRVWHVRSLHGTPGVDAPSEWESFNILLYGQGPTWRNDRHDVTELLLEDPDYVQISLGVWDQANVFGFPGTDATPAPLFDNVAFYKYRVGGPVITTRESDLSQDGFPANGSIDPADPDLLDIPFDMARDVNSGDLVIAKGDSVIVDVRSAVPGSSVTDIRLVWAMKQNPALSFTTSAPARGKDENFQDLGGGVWTGEVVADTAKTSLGAIIDERFFVDLPDEDFLHPGAVLHYYIRATDSDGRVSTLPADTQGFGDFEAPANSGFDRTFTVRGLPTLADDGTQPELLVLNDFGRAGGEPSWTTALHTLGYEEGLHYDSYTVQAPTTMVSNGIGVATPGQLDGYRHMIYFAGNLAHALLSNGDPDEAGSDKADDLAVLNDWLGDAAHARNIALFGDNIASAVYWSTELEAFRANVMGVQRIDDDVSDAIGGQTAPVVLANPGTTLVPGGSFSAGYVAFGGCLTGVTQLRSPSHSETIAPARIDQIQPLPGAEAGHWFTGPDGVTPIMDPGAGVASVIHAHGNGLAITFPYSSLKVYDTTGRVVGPSARTQLFGEILALFGAQAGAPPVTDSPALRRSTLTVQPNPFNPATTVSFSHTAGKTGAVKIFNVRGELVRTLHEGAYPNSEAFVAVWDGTDDRGAAVASGVYVVRAQAGQDLDRRKIALVK